MNADRTMLSAGIASLALTLIWFASPVQGFAAEPFVSPKPVVATNYVLVTNVETPVSDATRGCLALGYRHCGIRRVGSAACGGRDEAKERGWTI